VSLPLVVDLDGTLIFSDLLLESGLSYLKRHPSRFHMPLRWLLGGKAKLKGRLAETSELDVSVLPYNEAVLALIRREKQRGRRIVLATASHHSYAERIAAHLGLFDQVLGSDLHTNLCARHKRDALIAAFGRHGFDYAGNSADDLPVWQAARHAYLVNAGGRLSQRAGRQGNVVEELACQRQSLRTWLRAMRIHQWTKNLLIFVPLLASHQLTNPQLLLDGLLALLFFGLCASSIYILNDLLDLQDDRQHAYKRLRPFASGALPVRSGLLAFPLLLLLSLSGALVLLPWTFGLVLASYCVLTIAYSLWLKQLMAVDVLLLAMLYTSRIVAGTFAFAVSLTFWMLAFSMFIFLSLALLKRCAELRDARSKGKSQKTPGRGYYPDDLEIVSALGVSSGYLSVMVLALYIQEGTTAALYRHPQLIWLACPLLLFWITRIWMLTHRGLMHDDPVVFAMRDRTSLLVGAGFILTFWMAT
jgi:4-hydroxybenzoate polyprenyltransferase/phosphoserine phosphatase